MTNKHTFEYVSNYFKQHSCVLLSTKYINCKIKLKYICKCGNENFVSFNSFQQGHRCNKCSRNGKHTFEYVNNYFKQQNCILISTEYKNISTKLKYICTCGNESSICLKSFQKGARCRKCYLIKQRHSFEYVYDYFKKEGCMLLSTEYVNSNTKLNYICKCGNKSSICFKNFKNGNRCMKCCGIEKHTFEYVNEFFKKQGCVLLSTEYVNSGCKLNYICKCGNEHNITFDCFNKGTRCKQCGYEKSEKSGYTHKDYIFPSGTIRRIQGFENYILDELLKIYTEEQIITDRKDMPKIFYIFKGKLKQYYPDIYIPHLNKIIEVKSTWTFKRYYIQNMLKSIATKKEFEYEIWIYDIKNKKIIYF
jgi:hypothetical protein